MKTALLKSALCNLSVFILEASLRAAEPVYPLKVSENGRYFVDQKGEPGFWFPTKLFSPVVATPTGKS